MHTSIAAYQRVDALVNTGMDQAQAPKPRHPRLPGATRPTAKENPLGAWYVRCHVHPADGAVNRRRLLEGKTLAVKDTIAVAGVPMMNGSRALEGFTPGDFEATVVSRALDAGAVVTGKAVAEDLCCSGSSFATALGPVRNPHAPTHAAGGSSSGCGALVGAGEVDLALGTDQGVRCCWALLLLLVVVVCHVVLCGTDTESSQHPSPPSVHMHAYLGLHPHPRGLVRLRGAQADLRAGALHGHRLPRALPRPRGAHGAHRQGRGDVARGT